MIHFPDIYVVCAFMHAGRGVAMVVQDSIAERAGLTAGSIILKVNGESVLSFRAWSLASVFRSVEYGSLPELSESGDSIPHQGPPSLSLTVLPSAAHLNALFCVPAP